MRRLLVTCCLVSVTTSMASDWTRFRGPNGSGVSTDSTLPPTTFSETENLQWKTQLPGPGLSCPIVIGDRVVLTCWTGYAAGSTESDRQEDLKRCLVCLDRHTGETIWSHEEPAILPEDSFRGMFAENGYASHTPATDGERVYAFFGKSGVFAFDLGDGRKLWQQDVGDRLENRGWGSASSPIVSGTNVIVPAFIEGDALVAFDGKTGERKWEQKVSGYESNWSTPILVEANGQTELVLAVPGEVWGLNPDNGKLRWYCEVPGSDSARASVIAHGDIVIAMAGGRGSSSSVAIRAGGRDAVTPLWTGRDASGIGTPVIHNNRLYTVSNKVLTSVNPKTGERIGQVRLTASAQSGADQPTATDDRDERSDRGDRSGGRAGFGGQGGGRGGQDYSSPVVVGNHLYYVSRAGDIFVIELGETPQQIACNTFASDRGNYSATPAISNGQLLIRSSKSLYCVAAGKR
ncbi:MAG: PQQ-binding-like beta-propeller repeat protein [Planctomycetaceae bacterium]